MPQPAEVDRLAQELIELFRAAQDEITLQATQAVAGSRRSARLRELQRSLTGLLDSLDLDTQAWLGARFPQIYELGASTVAAELGEAFVFTQPHLDALAALAQTSFDDVLSATRYVRRDVKAWIRHAARLQTSLSILEGRTAQQAARDLTRMGAGEAVAELGRPIGMLRYADGSYRTLADHAEMLLRTTTANAYNVGSLNQMTQMDVGFVEVADGSGCGWSSHDDSDKANGTIRSTRDAYSHTVSHPRCRRSFLARPDLTKATARTALPSTTEEQRADQAAAEGARTTLLSSRRQARKARARRAAQPPSPPRQPRSPRSGPAAGKARPSDKVLLSGGATKFDDTVRQLDQLHAVDDVPVTVKMSGPSKNLGGKYQYRLRSQPTPRISINTRNGDTREQGFTFLHEFGHHIDIQGNATGTSRLLSAAPRMSGNPRNVDAAALLGPDPEQALLVKLRQSDAYLELGKARSRAWTSYARTPVELWARSYSQWAARKIGDDDLLYGLRKLQAAQHHGYHWSDDEFDEIAPYVEAVLHKWGLMA